MAAYFPLYVQIVDRRCVVVGGGAVAERKVMDLLEARAQVLLVSPEVTDTLRELARLGRITWLPMYYEASHLEDAWLVFAATNRRDVNAQIAREAAERRIFANIADAPGEGAFVVPSVVRRGDLCLSVSTGGASPMLARKVASELQRHYGAEYEPFVEMLGQMRARIKTQTKVPSQRRAALAQLIAQEAELRALIRAGDSNQAQERAEAIVAAAIAADEEESPFESLSDAE